MKNRKALALIGAVLLFIGVFMPIASAPLIGTMSYFSHGSGDGLLLLLFAFVAGGLALANRIRHVVWPAGLALLFMVKTYHAFDAVLPEMRSNTDGRQDIGPFSELNGLPANSIDLQWGWAILTIGAGILMFAGIAAWLDARTPHER